MGKFICCFIAKVYFDNISLRNSNFFEFLFNFININVSLLQKQKDDEKLKRR